MCNSNMDVSALKQPVGFVVKCCKTLWGNVLLFLCLQLLKNTQESDFFLTASCIWDYILFIFFFVFFVTPHTNICKSNKSIDKQRYGHWGENTKRKSKTTVSSLMASFMDMQEQQHSDYMQAEQQRQDQEQRSLDAWMNSQMEVCKG